MTENLLFSLNYPYIHIYIPIIIALITNSILYIGKTNKVKSNPYIPPGYIVGSVWCILFGILGYIHYLLYKSNNSISVASISVILFIIFSLAYPFITKSFTDNVDLLNIISLILAFILAIIIIIKSKYIFLYTIPLLLWISYVNIVSNIK